VLFYSGIIANFILMMVGFCLPISKNYVIEYEYFNNKSLLWTGILVGLFVLYYAYRQTVQYKKSYSLKEILVKLGLYWVVILCLMSNLLTLPYTAIYRVKCIYTEEQLIQAEKYNIKCAILADFLMYLYKNQGLFDTDYEKTEWSKILKILQKSHLNEEALVDKILQTFQELETIIKTLPTHQDSIHSKDLAQALLTKWKVSPQNNDVFLAQNLPEVLNYLEEGNNINFFEDVLSEKHNQKASHIMPYFQNNIFLQFAIKVGVNIDSIAGKILSYKGVEIDEIAASGRANKTNYTYSDSFLLSRFLHDLLGSGEEMYPVHFSYRKIDFFVSTAQKLADKSRVSYCIDTAYQKSIELEQLFYSVPFGFMWLATMLLLLVKMLSLRNLWVSTVGLLLVWGIFEIYTIYFFPNFKFLSGTSVFYRELYKYALIGVAWSLAVSYFMVYVLHFKIHKDWCNIVWTFLGLLGWTILLKGCLYSLIAYESPNIGKFSDFYFWMAIQVGLSFFIFLNYWAYNKMQDFPTKK
jgi:hypothetical protein